MAITREGARLTAAHRLTQQQVTALTNKQVIRLWPLLNATDRATWAGWLGAMATTINAGGALSARAAASYYVSFRVAEGVEGRFTPTLPGPIPAERIKSSMSAVIALSQRTETDNALTYVAGATQRLVSNQGRDTVVDAVRADPQAEGWARVASANCCAFCAMLASRGAVYHTEETAMFEGIHDHCHCSPEPSFDKDNYELPPNSQDLLDQYNASQEELGPYASRADRLNALRRYRYGSASPTGPRGAAKPSAPKEPKSPSGRRFDTQANRDAKARNEAAMAKWGAKPGDSLAVVARKKREWEAAQNT